MPGAVVKGLCNEDVEFSLNPLKGHVLHENRDFHCLFIATVLICGEKLGAWQGDTDCLGE